MNYYEEIKNKLIDNEIYSKVKDYSKERYKINTYLEIGRLLNEAGKHYGEGIIKEYSKKLKTEINKNYSVRLLYKMLKYYKFASNEKLPTLSANLSWSHYDEILRFDDINKITYYINACNNANLTIRQLRERIKSNEYERLPQDTRNKIIHKKETNLIETIKNPVIIKNKNKIGFITEKILQRLIMEDIVSFMEELGESFTFIKNEYKIKFENKYNYIDLLLYNIKYKCYVVIELKVTELKKEHIGQIEIYMNYIDKYIKTIEENKTVGIIICKKNNNYVIEFCSDKRIISRTYELI